MAKKILQLLSWSAFCGCSQRHTVQSRHDTSFLNSLFYFGVISLRTNKNNHGTKNLSTWSLFSMFWSLRQYVYLKGQYDNNNTKNCLQKYMNICENKKITIVAENKPAKIVISKDITITDKSIRENTTLLNIFYPREYSQILVIYCLWRAKKIFWHVTDENRN